ncbi:MFS transporter [Mucilaginibacter sp.]|uniref:MFS transporter n=1 Tax=Mucilaginibacter sp. TaxID=1882438 RepID=UPI002847682A|nr:MFS transporter [Mucilaginibacter sp.]MDR3695988.1 MFS transporter [Mucilaginibacter sp.]
MNKNTVGNYRWVIVALLFFATTINYLDRQIIGLLKPTLSAQLHWTETDYSHIVMAFTASYAIGLLLFGNVIDKIGTKLGYTFSIIIWSLAAIGHAVARSTFGFGAARSALGIGEGGNFPAAIKTVAEWFPKKERALATGIFNSGANIGAVVAPVLVPWILGIYGWQMAFIITGAIGFIWLMFWLAFYEIPSRHKKLTAEEYEFIQSDLDEVYINTGEENKVKWIKLLGIRQTWTFVTGKLLTDPIWYFFLFWLPSYFSSTFHIDLTKPSLPLVIVYTATTIGSIGGGHLSSWLIKKGWTAFKARKTAMLLFALCVVPIITARFATNIWQAVGLIGLAAAAHQAWSANIFTTTSDVFPKKAISSVVGIGSMAGAVGGFFFPTFIGYILDASKKAGHIVTGYNIIFFICGCAYLLAWVLMHFLSPRMKKVNLG